MTYQSPPVEEVSESSDLENIDRNKPWFEDAFAWGGVVRLLGLTPVSNNVEDSSDG